MTTYIFFTSNTRQFDFHRAKNYTNFVRPSVISHLCKSNDVVKVAWLLKRILAIYNLHHTLFKIFIFCPKIQLCRCFWWWKTQKNFAWNTRENVDVSFVNMGFLDKNLNFCIVCIMGFGIWRMHLFDDRKFGVFDDFWEFWNVVTMDCIFQKRGQRHTRLREKMRKCFG